jgi:hypothetical protein
MDLTNKGTRGKKPRKSSVLAHTKSIHKIKELKVDLTDEEIAKIQSHHLVKPSFCSLYYLINDGISIGQLATAIENHGVYGWDQYGRYQHFKIKGDTNSQGSGIALNVLASIEADFRSNKASKLFVLSKYFRRLRCGIQRPRGKGRECGRRSVHLLVPVARPGQPLRE